MVAEPASAKISTMIPTVTTATMYAPMNSLTKGVKHGWGRSDEHDGYVALEPTACMRRCRGRLHSQLSRQEVHGPGSDPRRYRARSCWDTTRIGTRRSATATGSPPAPQRLSIPYDRVRLPRRAPTNEIDDIAGIASKAIRKLRRHPPTGTTVLGLGCSTADNYVPPIASGLAEAHGFLTTRLPFRSVTPAP